MITLITGVPGSGKTLYALKLIVAIKKENDRIEALPDEERKEDELIRPIYTDIEGIDNEKLGTLPAPEDWRDLPDGAIVFYDECQRQYGPDGQGRAKDPRIPALETHRHRGIDLYFLTQRERLIHAHIRDLVGRHYHIQRQHGSHFVKVFRRDETIDTKSRSMLASLDSSTWKYDKELFKLYKSATIHTHKLAIPSWMKKAVLAMAACILFVGTMTYVSWDFITGASPIGLAKAAPTSMPDQVRSSTDSARANSAAVAPTESPEETIVQHTGCVAFSDNTQCQCFTTKGFLDEHFPFAACMKKVNGSNLAFRPKERDERRTRDDDSRAKENGKSFVSQIPARPVPQQRVNFEL